LSMKKKALSSPSKLNIKIASGTKWNWKSNWKWWKDFK
jgi:hypothetical protein